MQVTSSSTPQMCVGMGAALFALALAACVQQTESGARSITAERTWRPEGRAAAWGLSVGERFGFEREAPRPTPGGIAWETPAGWVERAPSSMRAASFLVAGDERADCSMTVLAGDGGGLLANVNRWRAQMSLAPIDAEELARSPRAELLGSEAVLVDFEGTWTGMSGEAGGEGYRLVGLLAVDGAEAHFLKMVGPAEVLEPERDAFLGLAASFRERAQASDPHEGLASPGVERSASLSWAAPASWRQTGARPAREVTFLVGEHGEGECYVTILGGTGGGAFANVNRWRNQMGQPDLTAGEFADLDRLRMLGTEGVALEVAGSYRGMGDELLERAALLGAVCELPGRAVFVKLIGPADVVQAAREEFFEFCESLERGG